MVAPVVMISACGLLCLALYNRLAAVVSRLRVFNNERLTTMTRLHQLEHGGHDDPTLGFTRDRLVTLEEQVRGVTARARMLRNALICLLLCVLGMLCCTLSLGLSLLTGAMHAVALAFFIGGVLFAVTGVILALFELARGLDPVLLEQESLEQIKDAI